MGLFALLLFLLHPAIAMDAPAGWQRVDFMHTQAFSYVNDDGASYFSVYPINQEAKQARDFFESLQKSSKADPDFFPAFCYPLKQAALKAKQTWCERRNGGIVALVEDGPLHLSAEEKARLVMGSLGGRRK